MICIDSDCIIDFLKGKEEAINIIKQHENNIATTEINIFEIFVGVYIKGMDIKAAESAEAFFNSINILNIDGWGKKAAKIIADLTKQGKMIEQNDCFIASIMLANGCTKIITRNIGHFSRIKGIEAISY